MIGTKPVVISSMRKKSEVRVWILNELDVEVLGLAISDIQRDTVEVKFEVVLNPSLMINVRVDVKS